jgi:hypothetical protein
MRSTLLRPITPRMIERLRAVVLTAGLLLAAGCGGSAEPAEHGVPGPPRSVGPDTAPSPLASSPAAPDTTTPPVTSRGWGPLVIGMTREEVVAASGEDANPDAVGGPEPEVCDEFRPARAPAGMIVMIERGRLTRITLVSGSELRTDRGLGVGDPVRAVRAAYGDELSTRPHKYIESPAAYLIYHEPGATGSALRGIVYEIGREETVTRIHAGGESIEYVEGCL